MNAADARNLYEIPLVLHEEGLDEVVCEILRLEADDPDLSEWEILVDRIESMDRTVRIGIIGKYVSLQDAYLSVAEALKHGGFHHGCQVEIEWIQAEEVEGLLAEGRLRELDGIVIPGGFGERGTEGKIMAAGYAREHEIPCLGLCLGLQMMTIEYARNVLGLAGANSSELDPTTPHPVIDLMETQRGVTDMGGTMRLGAYVAQLAEGSQVAQAYGTTVVSERHRHRYEFNPRYRARFDETDFWCSGTSPDDRLVEFIELRGHPFWVGTQAHPELKSRPTRPAPLFRELVGAALDRAEGRSPHLFDLDEERARRSPRDLSASPSWGRRSSSAGRGGHASTGSAFRGPDGDEFEREILRHPGVVVVVPLHDDGTVTLVRQYRVAIEQELLELPAGTRDVHGGAAELAAARELAEEAGLAAEHVDAARDLLRRTGRHGRSDRALPRPRA